MTRGVFVERSKPHECRYHTPGDPGEGPLYAKPVPIMQEHPLDVLPPGKVLDQNTDSFTALKMSNDVDVDPSDRRKLSRPIVPIMGP